MNIDAGNGEPLCVGSREADGESLLMNVDNQGNLNLNSSGTGFKPNGAVLKFTRRITSPWLLQEDVKTRATMSDPLITKRRNAEVMTTRSPFD